VERRGAWRREAAESKRSTWNRGKHRNDQHAGGDKFRSKVSSVSLEDIRERGHPEKQIKSARLGHADPDQRHQAEQLVGRNQISSRKTVEVETGDDPLRPGAKRLVALEWGRKQECHRLVDVTVYSGSR